MSEDKKPYVFNSDTYDLTPRYVPSELMTVRRGIQPVLRCEYHPPFTHKSVIREDMGCLVAHMPNGEKRYFGFHHAYINSELRMVVIGINKRDEVLMKWEVCKRP